MSNYSFITSLMTPQQQQQRQEQQQLPGSAFGQQFAQTAQSPFESAFDAAGTTIPGQKPETSSYNWDWLTGNKDQPFGVAQGALGVGQTFLNYWLGRKQLALGRDQLRTQKSQFAQQFEAQKALVNRDIEDYATKRAAANPDADYVLPADEYIKKHSIA